MRIAVEIEAKDVGLLRDVSRILRRGRVGDMVHDSWPSRVEELADRIARDTGFEYSAAARGKLS